MNTQIRTYITTRMTFTLAGIKRFIALFMLVSFLFTTSPMAAFANLPKGCAVPPKAMPAHEVKRASKQKPRLMVPKLSFSAQPSDLELCKARLLPEPLAPMHTDAISGENQALANALIAYKAKTDSEDCSDLLKFIDEFPSSRWRASVEINLGLRRFATGYLTKALTDWKSAWELARGETTKAQKAVADEALAQLVLLEARLGRKSELEDYLSLADKRKLVGSAAQKVHAAKQGDMCMTKKPGIAYKCGPYALEGLLSAEKGKPVHSSLMFKAQSSPDGTNLAQLKKWSDELGLHYQIAKRAKGAELIVPSLMHWSLGHFATIKKKENGRYLTQDPTFSTAGNMALSEAALDAESDGYFLVPDKPLPEGWQSVSTAEAEKVWGKGFSGGSDPPGPGQPKVSGGPCGDSGPPKGPGSGTPVGGMAKASAYSMQATLNIQDTPLGYRPPVGPDITFLVNYNDLESGQPDDFSFTNVGVDWSLNWLSYLTVDESGNATIRTSGGGTEYYPYSDGSYSNGLYSSCQLTVSDGVYQRQHADGSVEVFNQPDGSGNIFMTEMIDAHGNEVTITYDENFRITAITDAIGQESTLTYGTDTYGDPGFYVVTQITDPFSRSCSFAYDDSYTYLLSITDVLGIQSQFNYDTTAGDSFIDRMTTPYGSTSFYIPPSDSGNSSLQITYPDGSTSVVVNQGGYVSATQYWDREQMSLYPSDASSLSAEHCTTTQWCLVGGVGTNQAAVPYVITPPLDSAITYNYPGGEPEEGFPFYFLGGVSLPSSITRSYDSQTFQYEYNSQGNLTQSIDPLGRQFSYTYAENGTDLLEKDQTQTETPDINGIWASYSQHLPGSYEDGSGQVTTYTYNDQGQLLTRTDPDTNVWTMTYDEDGYLTQVQGPLSGSSDVTNISYDGYGRVYQTTDSEGYTLTYSYDAADRLTQVTYPDGTSTQTVYDKLDAVLFKDRIGRWTQSAYDSMEQLCYTIDPLGRKTTYKWCDCGSIASLTDPNGNTTSWQHDLEGRVIQKIFADGSPCNYSYDAAGRVYNRTDAIGQQTNYDFNLDDTVSSKSYADEVNSTSTVDYSYDANYLRLTSIENGWGTISYSYNPYITDPESTVNGAGKVSEITNSVIPDSNITYSYDVLGRVTNRSINGVSNSTTWAYDPMSRVTSETNPLGEFSYTYVDDVSGYSKGTTRLSSISYPNGQVTNFNWFDNQGDQRLQGIVNLKNDGTCLSQFAYGYDPAGQITAWQQQVSSTHNRVSKLGYDLAGELVSAQEGGAAGGGTISPPYQTQNFYSYDAGGNRIGAQKFATAQVFMGGTATSGDVVTLTVTDAGLSGGQETVNYTVMSGDDTAAIASGLSGAVNADSNLTDIGISSNTAGAFVFVYSASVNVTSYAYSISDGGTEQVFGAPYGNTLVNFTIVGTPTTGDVLTIAVHDPALSGGEEDVSYTVQDGDTLASIAGQLSYAISIDSSLSSLGVNSYYVEASGQILSESGNVTTYTQSVSTAATEGIVFSLNTNLVHNGTIGGTATEGDILTLTVYDSALSGGSESVNYTVMSGDDLSSIAAGLADAVEGDGSLSAIMSGSSNGTVLSLDSFSLNHTSYRATASSDATETIVLGTNDNGAQDFASFGGRQFQYNNVNELAAVSYGGVTPVQGTTNKAIQSASVASNVVSLQQAAPSSTTYSPPAYSSATETIEFSWPLNGSSTALVSGTVTTGDVVSFTINNSALPGGQEQISYTVLSGDSLDDIASGLASAVNGDVNLAALGITATASSANVSIQQPSTSYGWSISDGGTEFLALGTNINGNMEITVEGSVTEGDTLTVTVTNGAIAGGASSATYTVLSGDTFISIAAGLVAAINANTDISGLGITAANTSPGVLRWSQAFTASVPTSFYAPTEMSATDGGDNTVTAPDYTIFANGPSSFPSYDFNGNMTWDGTNSYSYDAENRLIQVTYPGDGNYSQFLYDGLNRCVQIVENVSGTETSTTQFVWPDGETPLEARDGGGSVISKYFATGQTIGGSNYFYTKDHEASIREVIDSSGNIQAQYSYDPFGQIAKLQGSLESDFLYTGHYFHVASNLDLTHFRPYNRSLARWLGRDPVGEQTGNLYSYVSNNPAGLLDPTGLEQVPPGDLGVPAPYTNVGCRGVVSFYLGLPPNQNPEYAPNTTCWYGGLQANFGAISKHKCPCGSSPVLWSKFAEIEGNRTALPNSGELTGGDTPWNVLVQNNPYDYAVFNGSQFIGMYNPTQGRIFAGCPVNSKENDFGFGRITCVTCKKQ